MMSSPRTPLARRCAALLAVVALGACSSDKPGTQGPAEDAALESSVAPWDAGEEGPAEAGSDGELEGEAGPCVAADAMQPEPAMVEVAAGPFMMGCNELVDSSCEVSEKPYHQVHLSAYSIDATEVTNGVYRACVEACACEIPSLGLDAELEAELPVVGVTVQQAAGLCAWLGRRLPTEAEWEKAARGTDGRIFPWGDSPPTCEQAAMLTCAFDGQSGVVFPVGTFSPQGDSPYGARDMAGNVWEWVSDWYGPYEPSASIDPTGPESGGIRLWRGGSHLQPASDLRASRRFPATLPAYRATGFRCARSL